MSHQNPTGRILNVMPRAPLVMALLLPIACAASTPEPAPHTAPVASTPTPPVAAPKPDATLAVAPIVTPEPTPVATQPTPADDCALHATIAASPGQGGAQKYTLTLKNTGTVPRTLVVPGDGSEYARRTPILEWSGTSKGQPAPQLERPACGMMNAITTDEIFTLAPGASRSMQDWILGPSYGPGTYEVRLSYHNDPSEREAQNATPEVVAALARTSACDVTSAPLTIKVR